MAEPPARWLGIDIGATKLVVRAETGTGDWETAVPWPPGGPAADLAVLRATVAEARRRAGGPIARVGVAAAPTIDRAGTVSAWPSRPTWVGTALLDVLTAACAAPVLVADDGSLAALAEAEAAGCDDLAYFGLGTGVGGGLVVGGHLVRGAFGGAGEIGHLPIEPYGPACECGRRGCLQARLSAGALSRRAGRLRGRTASPHDLVRGVEEHRRWALRTLDEAATALARAVLIVSELVEPAQVRIGGGLGAALPALPPRVTAVLETMRRPGRHPIAVRPAALGARASVAGAVRLARDPASAGLPAVRQPGQ
jgi:kanosamine 6-kinase